MKKNYKAKSQSSTNSQRENQRRSYSQPQQRSNNNREGEKSETSTLTVRAKASSDKFISKVRDEITKFKAEMESVLSENGFSSEDFKLVVNENTRKNYTGSVLCSVEITNKKKFKTSKVIIYHGFNGRSNQKFIMIANGVSDDIMFSNIGENAVDVFSSYLADILSNNLKYVMNTESKSDSYHSKKETEEPEDLEIDSAPEEVAATSTEEITEEENNEEN